MHEGVALRRVGESGRVHGIASAEIDDGESLAVPGVGKRADGPPLGLEAPQRERESRVSGVICCATVRRLVSICTLRPSGSMVSVFRVFTA